MIRLLENRIPPPIVLLVILGLMKIIANFDNDKHLAALIGPLNLPIALVFVFLGVLCAVLGVARFRAQKTTVNPLKPEQASSLVTQGIFRFTRNPMYLGMALVSVGWCAYLASLWALAGVLLFVLFIDRFQIQPEERVISDLFGKEFEEYRSRTRRWL